MARKHESTAIRQKQIVDAARKVIIKIRNIFPSGISTAIPSGSHSTNHRANYYVDEGKFIQTGE